MFCLTETGSFPARYLPPTNGLFAVHPDAVVIFTGIHTGTVAVTLETRSSPPAAVLMSLWDDVIEIGFKTVVGRLAIASLMDPPPRLPVLTPAGAGDFRIRVHVRGRDTEPDGVASQPVEDYLLVVWPGKGASEVLYKQSDEYGAMLRRSAARDVPVSPPPEPDDSSREKALTEHLRWMGEQERGG